MYSLNSAFIPSHFLYLSQIHCHRLYISQVAHKLTVFWPSLSSLQGTSFVFSRMELSHKHIQDPYSCGHSSCLHILHLTCCISIILSFAAVTNYYNVVAEHISHLLSYHDGSQKYKLGLLLHQNVYWAGYLSAGFAKESL